MQPAKPINRSQKSLPPEKCRATHHNYLQKKCAVTSSNPNGLKYCMVHVSSAGKSPINGETLSTKWHPL